MPRPEIGHLTKLIQRGLSRVLVPAALPATCGGCGVVGDWFCTTCLNNLQIDGPVGCRRCGRSGSRKPECWRCAALFPKLLHRLRAGYRFDDPMRRAVHRFKYNGEHQRGRDLGQRLSQRFGDLFPGYAFDLIVPVPLHTRRYRQRGFNQSWILAEELSEVADSPVVEAIRRVKHTLPQAGLTADARTINLKGAFEPIEEMRTTIEGSRMLVVDDVTTTGATLSALTEALSSAGAASVSAIALARER